MIHPNTQLRYISESIGYGVFATSNIPEGTIVYVRDSLEIAVKPSDYKNHNGPMKEVIDKYSYIDENGNRVISWDIAKYVNHCCNCNTISTGYGFEMAIMDIKKGDQITDEYGIFNLDMEMTLICKQPNCRKVIRPQDFDVYYKDWDKKIRKSIDKIFEVDQPLLPFVEEKTRMELDDLLINPESYKSVYALKQKHTINSSSVPHKV